MEIIKTEIEKVFTIDPYLENAIRKATETTIGDASTLKIVGEGLKDIKSKFKTEVDKLKAEVKEAEMLHTAPLKEKIKGYDTIVKEIEKPIKEKMLTWANVQPAENGELQELPHLRRISKYEITDLAAGISPYHKLNEVQIKKDYEAATDKVEFVKVLAEKFNIKLEVYKVYS